MSRARRACDYCDAPLIDEDARLEVRVAPDLQARERRATGTFCDVECWEAQRAWLARHLYFSPEPVHTEER